MDLDDLEPQNQPKKAYQPVNVEALSIEELHDYIAFLESETGRANDEIAAKRASISAADKVFKK
ncbi:MAG: DUF1192 domain-containing protein [Alphaproteobacteria bacterium]|nr:DUF1192 domain-containing protein [Alphaproteobacteria bacterium]